MKIKQAIILLVTLALLATATHMHIRCAGAVEPVIVRFISEMTELRSDIQVNQTFKVAVVIENVAILYGFDFQLNWTTEYLEYDSHIVTIPVNTYSTSQPPSPHPGVLHSPILPVKNEVNASAGTYWIGYSSMYPASTFNGSGTVAVFTFKVAKQPAPPADVYIHFVSTDLAEGPIDVNPIGHSSQDLHFAIIDVKEHIITHDAIDYAVITESNSTVSAPMFNETSKSLQFNVTGVDGATGYCNVSIPKTLMWGEWAILLDDQPVTPEAEITGDNNNAYIFFTYELSTRRVYITSTEAVPEYASWTSVVLVLATLATITLMIDRRIKHRSPKSSQTPLSF